MIGKSEVATSGDAEARAARLNRWKKAERIVLIPLLLLVVAAFFTLGRVEVLGHSMDPTLHDGQRLLILRKTSLLGPLKVGDIVVIQAAHKPSREAQVIKRIAFLQNAEGSLPWPEFLPTSHGAKHTLALFPRRTIMVPLPKNAMIVLGDNIENSTDSRDFGPIFPYEIYGKVIP